MPVAITDFLTETDYIDFSADNIKELAGRLFCGLDNDGEKIETAYRFVEKEIPHSSDIGEDILTFKASDVLKNKTGICYAKSNLFAALLRGQSIPAGFCYQYLTLNDDNTLTAINRFQRYVDTGTVDSKGRPLYVQTIVEEYAPITFTLLYKK